MVNCLSTNLAQKPNTTCETLSSSQECQFLFKQRMQVPSEPIDRLRFQVDFIVILGLLGLFLILGLGVRKCFTLKFLFCNISMHI